MEMVWIELNTDEGRNDATEKMLKESSLVCCFTLPHQVVFSLTYKHKLLNHMEKEGFYLSRPMRIRQNLSADVWI